jgi:hypothetical protein
MTDVRLTGHLTDTLANIARWYPPTADPPRTLQSQTRTAYGSRPPLPAAVLSLRRQTVDTLTSWALLVCEERDLRGPAHAGNVAALTSFLAAHAEWLAGFDGDYAAHELGHLAYRLACHGRRIQDPRYPRPHHPPLGHRRPPHRHPPTRNHLRVRRRSGRAPQDHPRPSRPHRRPTQPAACPSCAATPEWPILIHPPLSHPCRTQGRPAR